MCSIFDSLPDIVTQIAQSAQAVSTSSAVTVDETYYGMQPNTRVFFNVQFKSVVSTPVTVVVPGYGSVVITPVTSSGAPIANACPYIALQSNQYATFQLTGKKLIIGKLMP